MDSNQHDLKSTSALTLQHYEQTAVDFERSTRDHDVVQNIATLLGHIEAPTPWTILDFGCGPGRDLKTFMELGHTPVGLDGSLAFVKMAHEATGAEVLHQDFLELDLAAERFDGIFANASLQHVPSRVLPDVLRRLHESLKPGGVLFASIPRGDNEEGWSGPRYSRFHDLDGWRGFMTAAGFVELEHYYRPDGLPRDQQRWLASAWRKV
jgi:SAM-dependent methyltransferase